MGTLYFDPKGQFILNVVYINHCVCKAVDKIHEKNIPYGNVTIFVMENNFQNYLIILIIQIYTHVIPLFEGMLLYFKAKKTIFIYFSPVKLKVNVLNFI